MPERVQVFRMETRDDLPGGDLGRHVRGETRPETAFKRPGLPPWVPLIDNPVLATEQAARDMRAALDARPPGGKRPAKCIDLVFDLRVLCNHVDPNPHESDDHPPGVWTLGDVKRWAREVLDLVKKTCPDAPIASACLHLDENSVHVHIELAPIARDGDKVRLGNAPIREALARKSSRFEKANARAKENARKKAEAAAEKARKEGKTARAFRERADGVYLGFKEVMSLAQDAYFEHIGQSWGLERGKRGSKRLHQAVDRSKGMEQKLRSLEEAISTSETRLQKVNREIAEQQAAADEAREQRERDEEKSRHKLNEIRREEEHLAKITLEKSLEWLEFDEQVTDAKKELQRICDDSEIKSMQLDELRRQETELAEKKRAHVTDIAELEMRRAQLSEEVDAGTSNEVRFWHDATGFEVSKTDPAKMLQEQIDEHIEGVRDDARGVVQQAILRAVSEDNELHPRTSLIRNAFTQARTRVRSGWRPEHDLHIRSGIPQTGSGSRGAIGE